MTREVAWGALLRCIGASQSWVLRLELAGCAGRSAGMAFELEGCNDDLLSTDGELLLRVSKLSSEDEFARARASEVRDAESLLYDG